MIQPFKKRIVSDGQFVTVHVIEYDEGFWLVPNWILDPTKKAKRPRRIISLAMGVDRRPMNRNELDGLPDNTVQGQVLFQGLPRVGDERLFLIRELPDIWVPAEAIP